jgi:hypothetical protein
VDCIDLKSSVFWDIPYSPLKSPSVMQVANTACFMLVSSTLKIEGTYSSEKSVEFQRNTWRCIPEGKLFLTVSVRTSNPTSILLSQDKVQWWALLNMAMKGRDP